MSFNSQIRVESILNSVIKNVFEMKMVGLYKKDYIGNDHIYVSISSTHCKIFILQTP